METRSTIVLYAEKHDVIKDDDGIAKRRELAYHLLEKKKEATILTNFAPTLEYIKEVIAGEMPVISLSPASRKEEHIEVYKLPLTKGEVVLYTGIGVHHSTAMLLQSAQTVIALDDAAYEEAKHITNKTGAALYLLGGIGKKDVKTFFV